MAPRPRKDPGEHPSQGPAYPTVNAGSERRVTVRRTPGVRAARDGRHRRRKFLRSCRGRPAVRTAPRPAVDGAAGRRPVSGLPHDRPGGRAARRCRGGGRGRPRDARQLRGRGARHLQRRSSPWSDLVEVVQLVRRTGVPQDAELCLPPPVEPPLRRPRPDRPGTDVRVRATPLGTLGHVALVARRHDRGRAGGGGPPRLRRQRQPRAQDAGRSAAAAGRGAGDGQRRPGGGPPLRRPDGPRVDPAEPARPGPHRPVPAAGRRAAARTRAGRRCAGWSRRPLDRTRLAAEAKHIRVVVVGDEPATVGAATKVSW